MERIPGLAIGLVEGLVAKGKCYSTLLQMLGTRSVVERLAQLLLNLAELDGIQEEEFVIIDKPITHEILANMVGATRQWVTMTLDRFQKQGLIKLRKQRIVILDMDTLRKTAG